jgi:hypothetical protein
VWAGQRGALFNTQRAPSHFTAYVLTANINRRHMTKGQRAMATAMIIPAQQGKKKTPSISEEVSSAHLSRACTVLRHAPDAAALVLSGAIRLLVTL